MFLNHVRINNKWKEYDLMAAFFATIGVFIQFMIFELRISEDHGPKDPLKYPDPMDDPRLKDHNLLRILCFVCTVIAVFCVFMRHKVKTEFKKYFYSHDYGVILFYKYKEVTSDQIDRYHPHNTSLFRGQLFLELLIVGLTPIPFFDLYIKKEVNRITFYYFLNDYINAFMALRLYLVIRVFINYSVYTDMYSKKLCEMYGFYTDIPFALKSQLLNYPVKTISTLFVMFVLFYSYLIRIFESPYYRSLPSDDPNYQKFDSLGSSLWLCIITLTTVGYGDVYAVTPEGKIISACIAVSGAFLMALVVTIVTS